MSPIHIDVYVNERPVHTWHIGRIMGGTDPDNVNPYLIVKGPNNGNPDWRSETRVEFMHRYGDGIDTCIQRGICAILGTSPELPVLSSVEKIGDAELNRMEEYANEA
jgi:hypothetical protein